MTDQQSSPASSRPVVLCILDGWGLRDDHQDNAVALASTPNWDRLIAACPFAQLECSGENVGLPEGQMGNSEVGHLNLGAGRVVWQDLPRINRAIEDGSLAKSAALNDFIVQLKRSGGTCQLVGLVSPGGVHAHQVHIAALAKIVSAAGVPVCIHVLTDGRDTPPESASGYVADLRQAIAGAPNVSIATVCGRYFAMDRDNRWERVARAYNLIVSGDAAGTFEDPVDAIEASYKAGTSDEFMEPVCHSGYPGMRDGDGILYANFRADRVRELLSAILEPEFDGFERNKTISLAAALGMVTYSDRLGEICKTIFPPDRLSNTLGEVVARAGRRQLRAAETEKYPHVTYFFNGGEETPNKDEERLLVPSPKVATYDLQPEMSAPELTDKLVEKIISDAFDLIIINYANGDMVGHTGDLDAAQKAVETVDASIGQLEAALLSVGGTMLIIADHGNCETMFDREAGVPHTAHTLNPVPIVWVNAQRSDAQIGSGRLADVAPTVLDLMGIDQPDDMTGRSLIA